MSGGMSPRPLRRIWGVLWSRAELILSPSTFTGGFGEPLKGEPLDFNRRSSWGGQGGILGIKPLDFSVETPRKGRGSF